MNQLTFTKMQGLGNDFIVIDSLHDDALKLSSDFARRICDRRFGVGADQILWLKKPYNGTNHVRMEILNSDGSIAEMCGNGIRAIALYMNQHTAFKKSEYLVETLAGDKVVKIKDEWASVNMGVPGLGQLGGEEIEVLGQRYRFFDVDMGNPHAVIFVDDVASYAVETVGPAIEKHPRFLKRTNVEFVQVLNKDAIQVRVWERGAGLTLACGTGACAAAVASIACDKTHARIEVNLPGGKLQIQWGGESKPVIMEGPAKEVFRGTYFFE